MRLNLLLRINYSEKMISYNSTFPEQGNNISPMSFIQASFYQPVLADMAISPLAPNAFSYYNFKYLGASQQGDFTINKIQVIPKTEEPAGVRRNNIYN